MKGITATDTNFSSGKIVRSHPGGANANLKSINWSFLTEGDLYQRKNEHYLLMQAFQRQVSCGSEPELVLISGKSGVGKTALAKTLCRSVDDRDGFFISGKLSPDHVEHSEPYEPFVAALTDFTKCVIETKRPDLIESIKKAIAQALDPSEIFLLTDIVPAVKSFEGFSSVSDGGSAPCNEQPFMSTAGDIHQRLRNLFCNFIRAISSPEHPLVLLIDDLQWADSESLALLEELAAARGMDGLMLACTCRDNEVDFRDAPAVMLRNLDKNKVRITEIELSNLTEKTVNNIVADVLELDLTVSRPLAEVLYIRTKGNVFFVLELFKSLHEDGTIYMDVSESRWKWDESKMSILEFCDNLQNWLLKKMSRLSAEEKELLKVASCIGTKFDESSLCDLLPTINVIEVLAMLKRKGFISKVRTVGGMFKFMHDRFHQAAYQLIPEEEQGAFHLSIGRRLHELFKESTKIDGNLFFMVNQLYLGVSLISDQREKKEITNLFMIAGKQAMKSSDFSMAAVYFERGIDFLQIKNATSTREATCHWREMYYLSLELHNMAAEAEYINGNFNVTMKITNEILLNARSFHDKIRAHTTEVYTLGAQHKLVEALGKGLSILKLLGETFPFSEPSKAHILLESMKTQRILSKKSDKDLILLPLMMDHSKLAAMSLLNILAFYTQLAGSKYTPLFCCRMVQLTVRFGLSPVSSFGFAGYGVMRCLLKDFAGAYWHGQVALKVLDKFKIVEWAPRTKTIVYGYINHWTVPLRHCLQGLKDASQLGMQTGDIEFSMVAANFYVRKLTLTSGPLKRVEKEILRLRQLMYDYKQETWIVVINIVLQYSHNMMGKSDNPVVLTGAALDQEATMALGQTTQNNTLFLRNIYLDRLVLAYTMNDYRLAHEMSIKSAAAQGSAAAFRFVVMLFYRGITALALHRDSCKRSYIKTAKRCLKKIKRISRQASANCLNKVLLIEAELASSRGRSSLALSKYKASIAVAESEDFLHEQALALECAGQSLQKFGQDSDSLEYLTQAFHCYKRWGAKAKTTQMLHRYPSLAEIVDPPVLLQ